MTRDELIDKLEDILCTWEGDPCERYNCAISIMNTIFETLKDPTDEMVKWGCMEICSDHEAEQIWQDMINASPLSPNND